MWITSLPLVLLASAIALFPSFVFGEIEGSRLLEIRVEDILLVILGSAWIAHLLVEGRYRLAKPPLLFPILIWLGVGLVSVLTNLIAQNIGLSRGFFYFLKEIEFFFLYFYIFYHLKSIGAVKFIFRTWVFLGLVNVGWVVWQLTYENFGYYGPGALGEGAGPLPSGGFFLILFIFFFNVLLYYSFKIPSSLFKKFMTTLVAVSPALGVLTSGSRAAGIGLVFAFFGTLLLYVLKEKKKLKSFLIIGFIVVMITVTVFSFLPKLRTAERLVSLSGIAWEFTTENPYTRLNIWKTQTLEALKQPLFLFFGYGKSALLVYEESHSQYVRNFVETGIFGSLAFLFLLLVIIRKSFFGFIQQKDPFVVGLSAGLLVATLTMILISIPAESFIVVKIAETYWFFAAISMTALALQRNAHQQGKTP